MNDTDPNGREGGASDALRVEIAKSTAWAGVGVFDSRKAIELFDAGLTPEEMALVVHIPGSDGAKTLGVLYCDGLLTIADVKEALTGLAAACVSAAGGPPC